MGDSHSLRVDENARYALTRSFAAVVLQLSEIFYSLQGEGTFSGTPAAFIRLAGCNLSCGFCDTDYSLRFIDSIEGIVERIKHLAPDCPMVIITGGEPFIQQKTLGLIEALRNYGCRVHIESNGTRFTKLPDDVWLTISPKARLDPKMAARANEAKLIVDGRVPLEWIDCFPASTQLFLQPEGNKVRNIILAVNAVKAEPRRLRLSLQTHKFMGVR